MRSFYKQALFSAIFVALLSPAAFSADSKPAAPAVQHIESTIMARVNGKDITKAEFEEAVKSLMPSMAFHKSLSDRKRLLIQNRALENLIDSELIYTYAKENNKAAVDKDAIEKRIDSIRNKLPEGNTLEGVLKRSNMTYDQLVEAIRKKIVVETVSQEKAKEFHKKANETVTDKFMRDYYKNNLAKFKEPKQVHVRSILIKADPSGGVRAWNESRKRIDNVLATINQGMDFAEAATEYSEGPNPDKGGDMGWAHMGSMQEEMNAAIADLKVGEIAGPFTSLYGYHLVKLEGVKPAVQRKYEELNLKKLKKELQAKEYTQTWKGWIKNMHDNAKIEYITPIK